MSRFPKFCTRCGSTKHYAEDCSIPVLGMSQQERDMMIQRRAEDRVFALGGAAVVLALVLFGLLERF